MDVSPATDADFVVAATFDEEPGIDEVNTAIVECLEGSEREDEIVAQQMQQQLELQTGEMLKQNTDDESQDNSENDNDASDDDDDDDDDDDEYDDFYDLWNEDTI